MASRQLALASFTTVALLCAPQLVLADKYDITDKDGKPLERIDTFIDPVTKKPRPVRKNDTIEVYVDDCIYQEVKFDEKERHSRIYEDIAALFKKYGTGVAAAPCPPNRKPFPYTLKYDRSKLTVTATGVEEEDEAQAKAAKPAAKKPAAKEPANKEGPAGKETSKTATVIVGPKEHLYLGLDLPGNQKTLKYDPATMTLQPKDDKPQLYLSLNWQVGDLLVKPPEDWLAKERLSGKLLLLADSRPLDSIGLGVGYQMPKVFGLDLSAISVFGAHFWTKQDAITETGANDPNGGTAKGWRVGVTYDVGAGMKWLK